MRILRYRSLGSKAYRLIPQPDPAVEKLLEKTATEKMLQRLFGIGPDGRLDVPRKQWGTSR